MVEDGVKPGYATWKLLNAEKFEYKGKKYDWTDLDFTVRGEIPDYDPKKSNGE
jgi:hypothetical protein